ncbi:probable histidine kinase 1 [Diospyros lotus]|uniref:probable histidine kinase 1 n=1 Tax=Diospyros lotus TaxID=55363 RepID=UPI0022523491|nr:probable histidine kinase 1 [Diospyros lotus]XP_052210720.1 probable histidine kinase 1 [Diospyros lotus]
MVCEMETENVEEMDIEVVSSMWPEDMNEAGKQFNIERPGAYHQDMLEEVTIIEEPKIVDFKRLLELTNYSEKGSSQLAYLVKNWEYKQANAVRLLREELDSLTKQRLEFELKQLEILEQHRFEEESYGGDKRPVSILDDVYDIWPKVPRRRNDMAVQNKGLEIDAEYDTVVYWKQRAMHLEKLLEASIQREQILMEKMQESIKNLEKQSSPVEELSQILKRADNFLHFILQTAPIVIGHQDKELRYRFIYNHFPSLQEEDIIGKTDVEIFSGAGVKESQDFKREVLERGLPAKREITFETELFGSKTFLIYVEPVFSKAGETIGVNYMGMDVTDQVRKREKMAKLREEIAVQKAKETELNKTIHITEETMRAKQMLATMSHEIRSPLSGVVSMAEILATTNLDKEQRQLLKVMLSSGDLVLQLINDILDLSKVESGVMKLEATKFRPREVVRHVLQTAAASLQKILTLEGYVADDVPVEVIGDVLRIRQILTNLVSNAIKFTHEGKVGIKLYMVVDPSSKMGEGSSQKITEDRSTDSANVREQDKQLSSSHGSSDKNGFHGRKHGEGPYENHKLDNEPKIPVRNGASMDGVEENCPYPRETTVWLRCDVYDTGIGIPENALPTLFKKYMQVGADTARKYGGTGLGLAICKQLVELMGGHLTVSSREHHGSTFTFVLPYKVSPTLENSDDPDELSDLSDHDALASANDDDISSGFFQFKPRTLGSLFSSSGSSRGQNLLSTNIAFNQRLNGWTKDSYSFPSGNIAPMEMMMLDDSCSLVNGSKILSEHESSMKHTPHSTREVADGSEIQSRHKENGQFHNLSTISTHRSTESKEVGQIKQPIDTQEATEMQERSNRSSQCTSSSGSDISMSTLKPRILLVDDNKINVMVAQSMMKRLGHSIDVVNNGVEAVHAVQRCSYDLILMDVCMPVMNGLEATRLIRSFEETGNWDAAVKAGVEQTMPQNLHQEYDLSRKRTPIISMTANALSESADECYANGMDSFISKPVTFQKLKECLERYIK